MKIPTYDSGLSPTVVTPSPKSGASPVGEALQSVGSILGNVSEDLMQAERLRQASAKELEYERGYNEILEEAEKRPLDDEYVPYFTDKIKTLTQNSQTKNPQANELLQRVIGLKNLDLEHKVRGFYAKKVEGESIAQLNDKIALLEPRYYGVNTGDKKEDAYDREDILNELGFAINNRFETGIFTKPEAQKLFNDTIKNWKGEGQFNYDLGQAQSVEDLEAIGKLVKSNYYGKDPKVKLSYSNSVNATIKKTEEFQEKQRQENVDANERQKIDAYRQILQTDDIDERRKLAVNLRNIVNEDRDVGLLDANFAENMVSSLITLESKKEKADAFDKAMKFSELVDRNTELVKREESMRWWIKADFSELTKFRADVFEANAKGLITESQMTNLLNPVSDAFYRDPVFNNALNQLSAQSKLYDTPAMQAQVKAEMYNSLIKKVIAGKEPKVAVTEVIQERLNTELNQAIKVEEEFNRMYAKKGNQRIYSDDGGNTWYDEKTNKVIK